MYQVIRIFNTTIEYIEKQVLKLSNFQCPDENKFSFFSNLCSGTSLENDICIENCLNIKRRL